VSLSDEIIAPPVYRTKIKNDTVVGPFFQCLSACPGRFRAGGDIRPVEKISKLFLNNITVFSMPQGIVSR
jgi:hypothetical protein